jgi:uncharacterized membrane protein YiaA
MLPETPAMLAQVCIGLCQFKVTADKEENIQTARRYIEVCPSVTMIVMVHAK